MEVQREQSPQKHKPTFFKSCSKVKNHILHSHCHKEPVISKSCFPNLLLVFVVSFNACSCPSFCKTFPSSTDRSVDKENKGCHLLRNEMRK